MSGIRWQEPPPRERDGGNQPGSYYPGVIAELRARPGQWALIREGVTAAVASGLRKRFPDVEFRTVHTEGDPRAQAVDIYARAVEAPR